MRFFFAAELRRARSMRAVGRAHAGRTMCLAIALLAVAGCSSTPPANVENICAIFEERKSWYRAAKKSARRWGTPVHVQLAIIRQESSFRFDARPRRTRLLGFIPWTRPSNAYGYAQALDSTWNWYVEDTGRRFADRDDFGDAIDFVGWYTDVSHRSVGIGKADAYNQYLAYHEGQGGWQRGSFRNKRWLRDTARTVERRANAWAGQLAGCQERLDDGWWIF